MPAVGSLARRGGSVSANADIALTLEEEPSGKPVDL
jgi:hypothetical protein